MNPSSPSSNFIRSSMMSARMWIPPKSNINSSGEMLPSLSASSSIVPQLVRC